MLTIDASIDYVIEALKKCKEKGCKTVQINGTLFVAEEGNFIVVTSEPQM